MRLIGVDPGLRNTGWGVIGVKDNRLAHIADGVVLTDSKLSLAERLVQIQDGLRLGFTQLELRHQTVTGRVGIW